MVSAMRQEGSAEPPAEPALPAIDDTRFEPRIQRDDVKHTLHLLIVSFALAFVFRAFIVEPFVIPTGSMAPTLLGAHVDVRSPWSGARWAVAPRDYAPDDADPLSVQGATASPDGPLVVRDPTTGLSVTETDVPLRPGDRILVEKYIFALREPRRWDVVVFRSPEEPEENFIKRLVGLPGEEIRIVDGDVFTCRPTGKTDKERDWRIQRKPERVQRALWTTLFTSDWIPASWLAEHRPWTGPWQGEGWTIDGLAYRCDAPAGAEIRWEEGAEPAGGAPLWPIDDFAPYNSTPRLLAGLRRYPVSDLRVRASVETSGAQLFTIRLLARNMEFEARVQPYDSGIRMRRLDGESPGPWREIKPEYATPDQVESPWRRSGTTPVEFWHCDQSVSLYVGGRLVAQGVYDLSPDERLAMAAGLPEGNQPAFSTLDENAYTRPRVSLSVDGPARLLRLALDRDLAYQPAPTRRTFVTAADEYFVLGDNSAASRDARAWTSVDPWVASEINASAGVVPRELMMGRAFLVYFPAPHRARSGPAMPDFGRVRLVR